MLIGQLNPTHSLLGSEETACIENAITTRSRCNIAEDSVLEHSLENLALQRQVGSLLEFV